MEVQLQRMEVQLQRMKDIIDQLVPAPSSSPLHQQLAYPGSSPVAPLQSCGKTTRQGSSIFISTISVPKNKTGTGFSKKPYHGQLQALENF